jgi:glutamyl-tRNA synthetase
LRIDDLDRGRVSKDYVEDIFETLRFLGIPWDEGPRNPGEYEREYTQLRRMELYGEALRQLREEGKLFACTCSRTQVLRDSTDGGYAGTCRNKGIPLDTEGCIWRIRTEAAGEIGVKGITGVIRGNVSAGGNEGKGIAGAGVQGIAETVGGKEIRAALSVEMTDFVVRKRDRFPAYQLTSVIDDLHYGIDLVVRGEDLWPSTLAQQWLAGELGRVAFRGIHFYHHTLLMETGGSAAPMEKTGDAPMRAGGAKLSKSAGATSVRYLRQQGVQPADLYPMIVRMLGMDFPAGSWGELAAGVMG